MKKLLLLALSLVLVTACRKDTPEFPEESDQSAYQPLTKNSYWAYRYTDNTGEQLLYTHTLTGNTELMNNKQYYEATVQINAAPADEKAYYNSDQGIYTLLADHMVLWGDECEYLHSAGDINSTWNREFIDTSTGLAVPARLVGTVLEKV